LTHASSSHSLPSRINPTSNGGTVVVVGAAVVDGVVVVATATVVDTGSGAVAATTAPDPTAASTGERAPRSAANRPNPITVASRTSGQTIDGTRLARRPPPPFTEPQRA
jgi:hypothetical protein